ncbi:MAG: TIR domain-containing protein, partial [Phenylobacterium sp.]
MSDVFLSYKAEDRPRLRQLVAALEADGLSLWWDAQIEGGATWRQSIQEQLDAARCVVVVWSKRSVGPEGRFVHDEATRAQHRGVYLPILIDPVLPPLGFGETQALSLAGWKGDRADPRYQAMLAAVRAKVGGKAPEPGAAPKAKVDRRALIAGGAVLVAGAAGAGGWFLLKGKHQAGADSVAVLPFANLSGDPAQAYFSDGIAEELRNSLARIARLKVVARTSSEMVRDVEATVAARKLGVAYILTGSVRRSPAIVRVSAQLIDGETGVERWSETYDRPPGDALQIQTGIAENVAQALRIQLAPAERKALASGGTSSAKAHDLYLKGQATFKEAGDEAETRKALALFDAAIAADPNYAAAHAARSRAIFAVANSWDSGQALRDGLAQSLASAQRAVALDPKSGEAQASLAAALQNQMDLKGAAERFKLAYRLSAGDPGVIASYCNYLGTAGRAAEALPLSEQLIARDPLNPLRYRLRASLLINTRSYDEAVQIARKGLVLGPKMGGLHAIAGDALVLAGKPAEALAEYAYVTSDWNRLKGEAIAKARMNDRAGSDQALAQFKAIDDGSLSYQFAEIYAQRGEPELAIAALELA